MKARAANGQFQANNPSAFWDRVIPEPNTGCWLWLGGSVRAGYGHFPLRGRMVLAHRFAWAEAHGPVPPGLFVCHRCDNPPCCNPAHLFLGTARDNMRDKDAKGRGRYVGAHSPLRGERHPRAKLTWEAVASIRERHAAGAAIRGLARGFGVSQKAIQKIVRGEHWVSQQPPAPPSKK